MSAVAVSLFVALSTLSGTTATLGVDGGKTVVQGNGASFPKNLYWDAIFAYQFVDTGLSTSVRYVSTGSGKGKCRILSFADKCSSSDSANIAPTDIDYAGADSLLSQSDYATYTDVQMYPTVAGAVVPVYNLGNDSIELILSPQVLARIFRGDITTWDHNDIKALNSDFATWGVPVNQAIDVTVRDDKSGTTEIYRKALTSFETTFATQVGISSSNDWKVFTPTKKDGNQGVASHVLVTQWAIGYATLGEANKNQQPAAWMKKSASASAIKASTSSVEYAVMELGLSFGNNGDPPSQLTADIHNAQGNLAWPIAGYTYLILRKDTLRAGATCANRKATVDFWHWFYHSAEVAQFAANHGFATLPGMVRNVVVNHLKADIKCNGNLIFVPPRVVNVGVAGEMAVKGLFSKFKDVYGVLDKVSVINFVASANSRRALPTVVSSVTANAITVHTAASHTGQVHTSSLINGQPSGTLVFAGVGYQIAGRVPVILDGPTLGKILDGTITKWNDPAILALNPVSGGGVADMGSTTQQATSANNIVLMKGPVIDSPSWIAIMKKHHPTYTGTGINSVPAAQKFSSEEVLRSAIVGTPWSLAIIPYTGSISSQIAVSKFKVGTATALAPSATAIAACADSAAYNTATKTFDFTQSASASCYQLSQAVYISYRRSATCELEGTEEPRTRATAFIEWIFSGVSIDNAIEGYKLAPFRENALVKTHNTAILDKLTCKKESSVLATDVTTLLGIVAGCAVFILIFAYACDQYLKYAEVEEQRRLQAELKAKRKAAMGAAGEAEDCDVPSGMTCIVDTDVESSTALWDWNGPEMAKALLAHDQVMRAAIQANNGLELLTEGDAFTVSFSTCKDAVGFCLQVQSGLMQVPWSDALLNSGNESSARVMSDGAPIFAGLRVRMGAIYGDMPTGVKVSQLASQVLFQNCRDIGDFAHGGQILVSNQLWAEIKEADFPGIDVAALGSISKADSSESSESQLSCVQVLPRELANRVPEFIGMYQGNMDQIRPPCGKITIVFTSCADYKKIAEIDKSGAEQDIESIIELVQGITEKYRGYECKGSAGKFMLVFNTADDAVKCCGDINTSLLTQTWKADTTSLSSDPDFKGYTMAMGVATGIPTMFDFNKSSNTMDYFGPVVNLSARICGQACPGEITLGVTTNEELSPEVKGNFVIQSRGKVSLKGIKDEIEILSTMPSSLSSRMDKYEERRAIYSSGSAPMSPGSAVSPSD